jgi:hypothetical protein
LVQVAANKFSSLARNNGQFALLGRQVGTAIASLSLSLSECELLKYSVAAWGGDVEFFKPRVS